MNTPGMGTQTFKIKEKLLLWHRDTLQPNPMKSLAAVVWWRGGKWGTTRTGRHWLRLWGGGEVCFSAIRHIGCHITAASWCLGHLPPPKNLLPSRRCQRADQTESQPHGLQLHRQGHKDGCTCMNKLSKPRQFKGVPLTCPVLFLGAPTIRMPVSILLFKMRVWGTWPSWCLVRYFNLCCKC